MDPSRIYTQAAPWVLPILIVLFLLSVLTCGRNQNAVADLGAMLDSQQKKTIQIENERGILIAQNEIITASTREQLKAFTANVFELREAHARTIKAVSYYARLTQETVIKNKTAPFVVREPGDTTFLPQPADPDLVRVPVSFGVSDSTFSIDGVVTKQGVEIDSLKIFNTVHLRVAEQKSGFLGLGRTNIVQTFNSNPAIQTVGVSSVVVPNRPTWWQKWGKPAIALGAGIWIGRQTK